METINLVAIREKCKQTINESILKKSKELITKETASFDYIQEMESSLYVMHGTKITKKLLRLGHFEEEYWTTNSDNKLYEFYNLNETRGTCFYLLEEGKTGKVFVIRLTSDTFSIISLRMLLKNKSWLARNVNEMLEYAFWKLHVYRFDQKIT